MNSNLRPEVRPDKNGRFVTKHVRVDNNNPPKPLSVPKIFGIKSDLDVFGKWTNSTNIKVTDMLRTLDPEGLKAFRDKVVSSDDRTRADITKLVEHNSYRYYANPDQAEEDLHYAALLLPVLHAVHPDEEYDFLVAVKVFSSIANKEEYGLPRKILLGTESEQHKAIGAFITGEARFLSDNTVEENEWIGAHADILVPNFDRLKGMTNLDMELCREMVDSESPSLTSGIL